MGMALHQVMRMVGLHQVMRMVALLNVCGMVTVIIIKVFISKQLRFVPCQSGGGGQDLAMLLFAFFELIQHHPRANMYQTLVYIVTRRRITCFK